MNTNYKTINMEKIKSTALPTETLTYDQWHKEFKINTRKNDWDHSEKSYHHRWLEWFKQKSLTAVPAAPQV